MMNGALLFLGAALVAITVAQAASASVGELLSDPDRFRGHGPKTEWTPMRRI